MNKQDYIERLQMKIQHVHKCSAIHRESVPVQEVLHGETAWKGEVEVFDLVGHPAKRCYGWSYGEPEELITILGIAPADSPQNAVKIGIAHRLRKQGKEEATLRNGH